MNLPAETVIPPSFPGEDPACGPGPCLWLDGSGEGKDGEGQMERSVKKGILALVVLAAAAAVLLGVYSWLAPRGTAGEKTVAVAVVHGDGSQADFSYQTQAEYLGDLLLEEGLIAGEESAQGLFVTTVDGETADAAAQEWWSLTREGERINTGVGDTPLADGDHFELTLMVGW